MIDKKPKIGVIGAGHLGKHHIKHLAQHNDVVFVGAFDTDSSALSKVCAEFSVNPINSIEELVNKNIVQYLWSYERFRNRSGVKENIYN